MYRHWPEGAGSGLQIRRKGLEELGRLNSQMGRLRVCRKHRAVITRNTLQTICGGKAVKMHGNHGNKIMLCAVVRRYVPATGPTMCERYISENVSPRTCLHDASRSLPSCEAACAGHNLSGVEAKHRTQPGVSLRRNIDSESFALVTCPNSTPRGQGCRTALTPMSRRRDRLPGVWKVQGKQK